MDKQEKKKKRQFGLKRLTIIMAVLTVLTSFFLLYMSTMVSRSTTEVKNASDVYINTQIAASQLKQGSENLTKHVRSYVVTGELKFLNYYFTELNETRTYDNAYETLEAMVGKTDLADSLKLIDDYETKLKEFEGRAILLALIYYDQETPQYLQYLDQYSLSKLELNLEPEDKLKKAISLVFGDSSSSTIHYGDYEMNKRIVDENIDSFIKKLAGIAHSDQNNSMKSLENSVGGLQRTTIGAMIFLLFVVYILLKYVVSPLVKNVEHINQHDYLEVEGVDEVKILADSYNEMLSNVKDNQEKLSYEASHDALTGLLNRQAYLDDLPSFKGKMICFLHIDVDDFKHINDFYGHDVGDKFLKKLANILKHSFRSGDLIYRLGGDEFAVIMVGVRELCEPIIYKKAEQITEELQDTSDGLPAASVSIGASFSKGEDGKIDDMYKEADLALYEAKYSGKGKLVLYEEYMEKHLKQSVFN